MKQSQNIIQWLRQLTDLETELTKLRTRKSALGEIPEHITALRNLLPTSILGHHDALKERGRLSVAAARNGVCGGCHLGIPKGTVLELRRTRNELTMCNNCGVFLFLPEEELQQEAAAVAEKRGGVKQKARKKAVAEAAA
ncbi:C4-type zinc ribbon domain-containing protein [Verrucomicrobiota bacterium sgz303538]